MTVEDREESEFGDESIIQSPGSASSAIIIEKWKFLYKIRVLIFGSFFFLMISFTVHFYLENDHFPRCRIWRNFRKEKKKVRI